MELCRLGKRDLVAAECDVTSGTKEHSARARPDTATRSGAEYAGPSDELAGATDPARQTKFGQLRSGSPRRPGGRIPGSEARQPFAGGWHGPAGGNRTHGRITTKCTGNPNGTRA